MLLFIQPVEFRCSKVVFKDLFRCENVTSLSRNHVVSILLPLTIKQLSDKLRAITSKNEQVQLPDATYSIQRFVQEYDRYPDFLVNGVSENRHRPQEPGRNEERHAERQANKIASVSSPRFLFFNIDRKVGRTEMPPERKT